MSLSAADPRTVAFQGRSFGRAEAIAGSIQGRRFVYVATIAYAAVFIAAATLNYLLFLEPRFDLGNMVQVVWSTAHGHFMQMTTADGVEMNRFGAHVDPFLALLVPLWWIWASPIVLLAAQAAAVASGAIPVYWLARKHLQNGRTAALFAVGYLIYPATQFNAFTPIGIHAVSFAIPLILFAIWFLDEDRLVPFAIFALLATSTKEEIAAAVGGLGVWYALRRGRRRAGAAILASGLALTCFNMLVVIPHYAVDGQRPFAGRYQSVGGTPGGMLHVAATDPIAFLQQMTTWHKIGYLLLLFAPFLGLWLFEPLMLVGAVPDLAINLLSSKPEQSTIFYHYTSGIIPFIVAASVIGASRLRRHRRRLLMYSATAVAIVSFISPLIFLGYSWHGASQQQLDATRHAISLIPKKASVSVAQSLGGYVSARKHVAVFPHLAGADFVLIGPPASGYDHPKAFHRAIERLKANPDWRLVYDGGTVGVYERRA